MRDSINCQKPRRRLIELRLKSGKTQREIATDLSITETYLRLLEKGNATPSTELLFKIAAYYGVSVYECWPDLASSSSEQAAAAYE